jgi:hypothetical protein
MPLSTEVLLDHIADYLLFLSDAPLFWFTLNTSYNHPHPLVLLSSSYCATLLLSHLTGWLLCRLLSHRPLIILSLRRSLFILGWLVVALPLNALPPRPLVVPPSCRLIVLSLRSPLLVSLCWLVVVSPLIAPSSCHPLTTPPSRHLVPAGCCVASCCAALSSSHHAALLSSHRPLTALTSGQLIALAGCWVASCRTALSLSSPSATLSLSCSSWLLCCISLRCPLILLLCRPLVISLSSHCAALLLSHRAG